MTPDKAQRFLSEVVWNSITHRKELKPITENAEQSALSKFAVGSVVTQWLSGKKPTRTEAQNRALHLWFEMVAQELNEGGYTVQLVLKEKMDLDWDKDKVKELLWRDAQKAILKKQSTTELKKSDDIDQVYDHLNRHLGEKFGIHVPFPSDEYGERDKVKWKV